MIMANNNLFIHNTGLNKENSLMHLLDVISPEIENEVDLQYRPALSSTSQLRTPARAQTVNI